MRYYTNLELAKRFGVSANTIGYWVDDAVNGKNELKVIPIKQRTTDNVKHKIISNQQNLTELERLYLRGRSRQSMTYYSNVNLSYKDVNILNEEQINDILCSLDEGSIPLKYSYMNQGAKQWDEFVNEGYKANSYQATKRTESLLRAIYKNINLLNPNKKYINIFDIGCGNFLPVAKFVNNFETDGLLKNYIGIDISNEMLEITKNNALKYIPETKITLCQKDIESSNALYLSNSLKDQNTINIFLLLGGTIGNYKNDDLIFKNLYESMNAGDLLFVSSRTDPENTLDIFHSISEKNERLFWIPKLIGINTDDCIMKTWYDDDKKSKYLGFELNKEYTINYTFNSGVTKSVHLPTNQRIVLASYNIHTITELILKQAQIGLKLKEYLTSESNETGLIITSKNFIRY